MIKTTSLTAEIARTTAAEKANEEAENNAASKTAVENGWVWVRLIRPHYDAAGFMHMPGIVKLEVGKVPSSATVLSGKDAAEAAKNDLTEAKKVASAQASASGDEVNDDV